MKSREGYRIVRTLTGHPALRDFPPLPSEALWDPLMRRVHAALLSRCPDLEAFCLQEKDGLRPVSYTHLALSGGHRRAQHRAAR